jgi:hypothetical protein
MRLKRKAIIKARTAVATRTSRRVKAEEEDLTTEDTENTEGDTKGAG